jgi:two-component system sensor histidine kinase/response regulator
MKPDTDSVSHPAVLVVDDTETNLDIVVDALSDEYEVSVANDGVTALEFVGESPPDLILLDIMMPGMDGFEVCRRLKENQSTELIPVIFLTAKSETDDIVHGFDLGAADYLQKPFRIEELRARVHTHVEIKRQRDVIRRKSEEQKELVHILCHDLANPFGNILGVLSMARDDGEMLKEYAPLLEDSARTGTEVIQLVRLMRAVEEKPLDVSELNVGAAVSKSLSILKTKREEKGVVINVNIPESMSVQAEEVSLVNSVLNNLLTNAIKFSYPGGVIEINATGANTLRVRDYGAGMPPGLVNDLFDVSKATSRPGTAGESGTGFGMPLVKKFMESYGGSVLIESWDESEYDAASRGTAVTLHFATR